MEIITDSLEAAFASLSRYNVLACLPSTDLWGIQLRLSESISWTGSQWLSCSGNSPTGHAALVKLNTGQLMYYCSLIALILRAALLPHDTVNASNEMMRLQTHPKNKESSVLQAFPSWQDGDSFTLTSVSYERLEPLWANTWVLCIC